MRVRQKPTSDRKRTSLKRRNKTSVRCVCRALSFLVLSVVKIVSQRSGQQINNKLPHKFETTSCRTSSHSNLEINMSGNKKTVIHPLPSKEFLSTLRLRGPSAVPLVKRVNLPNGQSYHPVFLPFDARIICPWCCKESAISTYPQHIQGPK